MPSASPRPPPAPVHPLFSQPSPSPPPHDDAHAPSTSPTWPFRPSPYSHEEQAPSSPSSSSPFSLRSHQLREARVALDGLAGAGAAFRGAQGGPGWRGGGGDGTPYFEAEGETLFGPSPGTGSGGFALPSPYSLSPSSPSPPPPPTLPPKYPPAKSTTSPEERRRLREKYALGREEEEKLGRLLGAVYAARGAVGGAAEGGGTRGGGRAPPGGVDPVSPPLVSPHGPSALPPNLSGVSLPDSPPSTTSSRRSRRREYPATIETVLATAAEDGQRQLTKSPRVVALSPPPAIDEGGSRSGSERYFTPPEDVPAAAHDSSRSPHPLAAAHFPPSSSADATPTRSPRTAPDRSPHLWASTTPLDSPRPPPTSRPVSPPSGASSPSLSRSRPSSLHRAFYPSDYPFPSASSSPVVSPPTSPPAERSLTPFPPLPPGSSLPDPSFVRPSTHRTLPATGDYLPSRSGVRVYNHRPQVDGALSREEEEWVERMRRVPNDGMLRDWWGYPVGMRSGWGRAVLSPIATETEPTHSSPSYSHIHSPSHQRAHSHSASSPRSLLFRSPPDLDRRYQSFAAPSSPLRQVLHDRDPVSAFSSSPSALSSVALNSLPRRLRSTGVEAYDPPSRAPLANGVVGAFPDEAAYPGSERYRREEHAREGPYTAEEEDDGLDALSTVASHRAPLHTTPYSASLADPLSTARATRASSPSLHSLRPVVADAARRREEESDSPSRYSQATPLERSGVLPGSAPAPSPARGYGDAPSESTSRRRDGGEGKTRSARSSPTKRTASASGSSRTEAVSEWARGVSHGAVAVGVRDGTREGGGQAGGEGWEGRPSPPPVGAREPLPQRRDGARSRTATTTTTLPRGVEAYSDAVGMSPRPASRSERREGREERLATPSPPSLPSGPMPIHDSGVGLSSGRRRREEEHPAAPTSAFSPTPSAIPPPSRAAFPAAADAWGAPAPPPRDLAGPREEVERSPPSGRSPEDVAAWAREAGRGGAEEPAMEQWREREETRRSPPSKAGTAAAVAAGVAAGAFSPSPRSPARSARRAGGPDLGGAGGLSIDALLASSASPTRSFPPPQHAYAPFSPPSRSPFAAHDPLSPSHSPRPAHDPLTPPSRFASLHDPQLAEQDELAARLRAAHSSAASEDLTQAPWPDSGYFPPSGAGADDNLYSPPRRASRFPPQRPTRRRVAQPPPLSEEEKQRRRELRKLGRSPEFGLEHEETKAGRRKRAWGEWQAFDKEKNRLLGLLTYSGPADVPVYNALAELHLNAPAQASRDLAEEFWVSSLRLEKAQPDVAHQLAELLELRDPFEALHWHRVALHHDPSNPEHHLALARCFSLTGSLDAALDAYSTLSRAFPGTPYEALGLFQLGRLYQDYGDGRSEEKAAAKEAYQSALTVVGRLRLVEPERRTGGRWEEVGELERALVARLAELGGEEDGASPASRTPHGEATPATLRRNPSSSFPTSPRFDQPRSPFAPPSLGLGLGGAHRASTMSNGRTPTTSYGGAVGQAGPTSRHLGSTLDLILSSLHRMASSPLPADLARSSRELAQQVEETYRSLEALSTVEREKEKELLRAFEELRGELEKLPERLVATATLSAARPVHVTAPPPSPQPANLLQEALNKLERARQLTERPSAVAVEA
ncbi:hypothetical protein JCM8097_002260 [Rhodosporidiobolus ruineniae]